MIHQEYFIYGLNQKEVETELTKPKKNPQPAKSDAIKAAIVDIKYSQHLELYNWITSNSYIYIFFNQEETIIPHGLKLP